MFGKLCSVLRKAGGAAQTFLAGILRVSAGAGKTYTLAYLFNRITFQVRRTNTYFIVYAVDLVPHHHFITPPIFIASDRQTTLNDPPHTHISPAKSPLRPR